MDLWNPVEFLLSVGDDYDSVYAIELLERIEHSGSKILTVQTYGPRHLGLYSEHESGYTIPPQGNVSVHWQTGGCIKRN